MEKPDDLFQKERDLANLHFQEKKDAFNNALVEKRCQRCKKIIEEDTGKKIALHCLFYDEADEEENIGHRTDEKDMVFLCGECHLELKLWLKIPEHDPFSESIYESMK